MRENIFDAGGNHIGWKDKHADGTIHVYSSDGSHKGWAGDSGTFSNDGAIKSFNNIPDTLLEN